MRTCASIARTGALLLLAQVCRGADPLDNWSQQSFGTNIHLTSIAFGGGQFVAAGHRYDTNRTGLVITSPDGLNWTQGNSEMIASLRAVTYGNGQFVAVGDQGTTILSSDGTNWTKTGSGTSNNLARVACGNDQYIAVGFGYAQWGPAQWGVTSRDGSNWTSLNLDSLPSPKWITGMGYGAGQFIMLRNSGIFASTDGTSWTDRFLANGASTYSDVAFGNGRFVVVGSRADIGGGGNIATSPDAITWSAGDIGDRNLSGIAFGSSRFVAVGGYDGSLGGFIVSSPDGVDWRSHPSGTQYLLEDIAYGNGRFVAVGNGNAILSTPPLIMLDPMPDLANSQPQFKISATPGQSCRIQASTDLTNWLTLTHILCADGVGQFVDLSATNFSQRFYQAVSP